MLPLPEAVKKLERLKELVDEYNPIKYQSSERTTALHREIPQLYGEVADVYKTHGGSQRVELVEGKHTNIFPNYFEAGYLSGRTFHASQGYNELLKVLGRVRQEAITQGASGLSTSTLTPPTPRTGGDVFIVHGHDEVNLTRLRNLVEKRFHLHPVILKGKAGKGRTLIEKFEEEAERCAYAFVLLTPDDQIVAAGLLGGGSLERKDQVLPAPSLGKAEIRARLYDAGNSHRVELSNKSAATASDVDIEFLDQDEDELLPQGERTDKLPIPELEPGEAVTLMVALVKGRWPPFKIALKWKDPDGTPRRKEDILYGP